MTSRTHTKQRSSIVLAAGAAALACLLTISVTTLADKGGGGHGGGGGGGSDNRILSPVILASDGPSCDGQYPDLQDVKTACNAIPVMMTPDGKSITGIRSPGSAGDLTHGGPPRYAVDFCCDSGGDCTHAGGYDTTWPPCSGNEVVIVTSDDSVSGDPSYSAVLLDDPDFDFTYSRLRWSPDGSRLAFWADHTQLGSGIFVAEVFTNDDGQPEGLFDIRNVWDTGGHSVTVSWSGDNVRVCFALPDDGGQRDVWVLDVDTQTADNVTNSPDEKEQDPAFSPIPGDDRLVFARFMYEDPNVPYDDRRDLFILDLLSMTETQVTNESNAADLALIRTPDWSPDTANLVFAAGLSLWASPTPVGVFRIPADGSANAKRLTRERGFQGGYSINTIFDPRWRD